MFHVKHLIQGIIFDFNGTLYQDADINYETWKQTIKAIDNNLDFEELYKEFKSTKDSVFITEVYTMLNKPIIEEEIEYWVNYKENRYRQMCVETNRNYMRPGAIELLNYCLGNNIPINLCTSSIKDNVDFYFKNVNLDKWFDRNKVIYDSGEYLNKIQMYKDSAKIIGLDIENCLVFEDSMKSLKESIAAGCKNVVRLSDEPTEKLPEIKQVINDFTEFDYNLLKL